MNVEDARELFSIEGQFSKKQLLKLYRAQARVKHPDIGGSEDAFKELQEAYSVLLELAGGEEPGEGPPETVEGVLLSELGKGYPITESAKTCDVCDGKGYKEFTQPKGYVSEDCPDCGGHGIVNYPCKRCEGTGKYKNPRTGKEVGECYACRGLGRYYPVDKRGMGMFQAWFTLRKYIPGTNKLGIKCKTCNGDGVVMVPMKEGETFYQRCSRCEGIGEVKMWNPVLPRGFLKAKGG